ncbi:MAG: aryldialkylphosphatase [Candidatus Abyssobacteria bacterium SURF_17]|uniref:Aryldialkylphosphatase n=1 Tax=Candidatus Abyssobacteria bacterium SURF_17 TaxID=2093361 RepID=A0A419EP62_9BACT|nr:MAG: aryldialkylphosphatase [Candidatus Abyssubacteria bacterium SURF_17]
MNTRLGRIQTVLGLINPAELGFTQTHEHLLVALIPEALRADCGGEPMTLENIGYFRRNWLSNPDNLILDNEFVAIQELKRFKDSGGNAIVELTPIRAGREPEGLARISRATGVHIIMGASFYTAAFHPPEIETLSEGTIAETFASDITTGADGTTVKAGIIGEIGLDWPLHENEAKALRAAAMAQSETGAALNIHPGRDPQAPFDAIRIIKEAGGNPERTVMSHVERTLFSLDDMLRLAETGCYLEFDLFGQEASYYPIADIDMPNDATRVDYLIGLIKRGHRDKLLLSLDICHKTQLARYGGDGYNHILDNVLPIMRRKGMSDHDIEALTVRNPARMLAFV